MSGKMREFRDCINPSDSTIPMANLETRTVPAYRTQSRHGFLLTELEPLQSLPENIEDDCAICFDVLTRPVRLPCRHVFCRACIESWLTTPRRNKCPLCRHELFSQFDAWHRVIYMPGVSRAERVRICTRGLADSGLLSQSGVDIYDTRIRCDSETLAIAASSALTFLTSGASRVPRADVVHIDPHALGPHLAAMGNLICSCASVTCRQYSEVLRRDWQRIIRMLFDFITDVDGVEVEAVCITDVFRHRAIDGLRNEGTGTRIGGFFERNAAANTPAGDYELLMEYVVLIARLDFNRREAHRRAQESAISGEKTLAGKAWRWLRQAVTGEV